MLLLLIETISAFVAVLIKKNLLNAQAGMLVLYKEHWV